jgi:hypothetical protein
MEQLHSFGVPNFTIKNYYEENIIHFTFCFRAIVYPTS